MKKKKKSGKSLFIQGSLLYLWEEIKTMNSTKFRALKNILIGYVRMKLASGRKGQKALTYNKY